MEVWWWSLTYLVHLLFENRVNFVALGQRGLELIKLLRVQHQLQENSKPLSFSEMYLYITLQENIYFMEIHSYIFSIPILFIFLSPVLIREELLQE